MTTARFGPAEFDRFAEDLNRDGICILRGLINRGTAAAWAAAFDALFRARQQRPGGLAPREQARYYLTLPWQPPSRSRTPVSTRSMQTFDRLVIASCRPRFIVLASSRAPASMAALCQYPRNDGVAPSATTPRTATTARTSGKLKARGPLTAADVRSEHHGMSALRPSVRGADNAERSIRRGLRQRGRPVAA